MAPGSLVSVFGDDLVDHTASATPGTRPTEIKLRDGSKMQFYAGGSRLELLWWSPQQVNAFIPADASLGARVPVRAERLLADGTPLQSIAESGIWIRSQAPGLFVQPGPSAETPLAIVTDASANLVDTERPAVSRSTYVMWLTGLGPLEQRDRIQFARSVPSVVLNIVDTLDPVEVKGFVEYAGSSGHVPGLDQINLVIPPLQLQQNCNVGQQVTLRIEVVPTVDEDNPVSSAFAYLPFRISAHDCR